LAKLEAQPKAFTADAEQTCASTDEGRIVPREGGGDPDINNAARNAGSFGDRPLVVLTAGRYWAPPGFEKEAAEYHEIWVHQLQTSLVRLSTRGRQVIVDAHHDMAESPDSIVKAIRQVVDEVRANNNMADARVETPKPGYGSLKRSKRTISSMPTEQNNIPQPKASLQFFSRGKYAYFGSATSD
jgi:hypothetical protein